jgi:putative ABC transport system substrate-binding protein
MERRVLLISCMVGLAVTPIAATFGQQSKKFHRLGLLLTSPGDDELIGALKGLGYVEGQSMTIERRYMSDRKERLSVLGAELVQLNPDVIVVVNGYQAAAVRETTKTIPIVTMAAGDLVAEGLVTSLSRPAGNITGCQVMQPDTAAKRVTLLKEAIPNLSRLALLFGPVGQWFYDRVSQETEAAATALKLKVQTFQIRTPDGLEASFGRMQSEHVQGVLITGDQFTYFHRRRLADLAMQYGMPAICDARVWAEAGSLMSYGADITAVIQRAAAFVDKIFKGAKPAELPVEQPTKFELVINLKTAKALGLTIPPSLLQRADQVIE